MTQTVTSAAATQAPNFGENPTFRVTLKGISAEFTQEFCKAATDWVVDQAGGYDASLKYEPIVADSPKVAPVVAPVVDLGGMIRTGRIVADAAAAREGGFALGTPLFRVGTLVNDLGVENARTFRVEYDRKPTVDAACGELVAQVAAEQRRDRIQKVRDLHMTPEGDLEVVGRKGTTTVRITASAFDAMCYRGGWGGARYLRDCWPELRAQNVNAWVGRIAADADEARAAAETDEDLAKVEDPEVKFRVRTNPVDGQREVFGAVSPKYAPLDVDEIAKAIAAAAPAGTRAAITYNGERARFEVLFHSTVAADDYGCGEIFRAGVVVRTSDVGDGAIKVSAMVERNLCLNLIILDKSETQIEAIRHIGGSLVERFQAAFAAALSKIEHFTEAWGYARKDVIEVPVEVTAEAEAPLTARDLLAAIAWAQIQRQAVPVKGKKVEAVRGVLRAYDREDVKGPVLTRADVVNAWTRYAHEEAAAVDPWIEDEIQEAAGRILASHKPLPIELPKFAV